MDIVPFKTIQMMSREFKSLKINFGFGGELYMLSLICSDKTMGLLSLLFGIWLFWDLLGWFRNRDRF